MASKKKNKIKIARRKSKGASALPLQIIIATAIIIGAWLIRDFSFIDPPKDSQQVTVVLPTITGAHDNLQLYTFGYTTVVPTKDMKAHISTSSGTLCDRHSKMENCECPPEEKIWPYCKEPLETCNQRKGLIGKPPNYSGKELCFYDPTVESTRALAEKKMKDPNCELYCIGKPVIYLYPEVPTVVDVAVTSVGRFYISDPLYPNGGWQDVLAHPDGTLIYQGNTYKELYYETEVTDVRQPKTGFVIPTADLKKRLIHITTQLGLKPNEQQEFLDYWLPQLYELKSPYILFSLVEPNEKERIDHVDIVPQPDTFIHFLAYFKPINTPFYDIEPLILPQAPQRKGFTAVEWGGTIDRK